MTADQIVERKGERAQPEETDSLTGSISFENFLRPENEIIVPDNQALPEPPEIENDSQEPSKEVDLIEEEEKLIDFPIPKSRETPFDWVEELKRKKIKPAA